MVVASISVPEESDFSPRKLKVAAAIIVGTLFGSTVLPMMALGLLLLPMTEEYGWSRTSFSLGMSPLSDSLVALTMTMNRMIDLLQIFG